MLKTKFVAPLVISIFAVMALTATRAEAYYGVYSCDGSTTNQCVGNVNDDSNNYIGAYSSDCYGACGPGCSYNCSSGGACLTHDYYTRTYGMFSSQAMSAFPAAAAQWGACVMNSGYAYVSGALTSLWSGISRGTSKLVNKIFN